MPAEFNPNLPNSETENIHREPISKTWRPIDEARFLKLNPQLSDAQVEVYLERSVDNFLLEHSFGAEHSFFAGRLAPEGHMEIQGANMTASWALSRERFGSGSNEDYEVEGYEKAHQMLRDGAAGVIISSPQKTDVDRRFTFILMRGLKYGHTQDYADDTDVNGEWITQINLMHKGDRLPFEQARRDYVALEELTGQEKRYGQDMHTNQDMLVQPIAFNDTSDVALDLILSTIGIGEKQISRSRELQQLAGNDQQLSEDVTKYIDLVRKLAEGDLSSLDDNAKEMVKDAEALRNGIYMRANTLSAQYKDRKAGKSINPHDELAYMNQQQRIKHWRDQKEPEIIGGISCPRPSDSASIWDSLKNGESMQDVADGTVFCKECPECKAKNIKAKVAGGKIKCPECKAEAPYAC